MPKKPLEPRNASNIQNNVTAERKEFIQSIMNEIDKKAGVESAQEARPGTQGEPPATAATD